MKSPDKRLDENYQLMIAAHQRGDRDEVNRLVAQSHVIQREPAYRAKIARMLMGAAWHALGRDDDASKLRADNRQLRAQLEAARRKR
jgi:hypothetical protein